MGYKMGVVGLAILFIFYIVLAFIMENVGMEKIIPLEFIIKKKRQNWASVFEWTEYDGNPNLGNIENIISFLKTHYFQYTSRDIDLNNGWSITQWNLQKFDDKMLCPFELDVWENLCYRDHEDYSFVFLKVLCCEEEISNDDYATVIDTQTGESRYVVQWWETFSKWFIIGVGLSKEPQLNGKQYTWYLFHMTKGQNSMAQAASKLLKKIFNDLWYQTTFWITSDSQEVEEIWQRIKKLVLIKKITANVSWGWWTEIFQAELTIKSNSFLTRAIEWTKDLFGKQKWERVCLEIMDEFWWDETEGRIKAVTVEGGREKTHTLERTWGPSNEQIIAILWREVAYTESFFTLTDFANLCLDYINSSIND